jgi:hypothetical protein
MLVCRVSLEAVWHLRHGVHVGGVADRTGRGCAAAATGSLTQPGPVHVVLADPAAVVATGARLHPHPNMPSGLFIAGDVRFFTFIKCGGWAAA